MPANLEKIGGRTFSFGILPTSEDVHEKTREELPLLKVFDRIGACTAVSPNWRACSASASETRRRSP
jgi:hypothetical protein